MLFLKQLVKEVGFQKKGQTVSYSFFFPKNSKQNRNLLSVRRISIESIGTVVMKNILRLKKIEKIKSSSNGAFAKACEKCSFFVRNVGKMITNVVDYASPKVQNLIFKKEDYDWRCSNYPLSHAKIFHCAERKEYGK